MKKNSPFVRYIGIILTIILSSLFFITIYSVDNKYTQSPVQPIDGMLILTEDDLDNKVIYDEVISAIIKKKPHTQFLFATHNANIPVLGDAEKVLVIEFQDTKIDVLQGNIDLNTTHKQIVDIMEGGTEAFERRKMIYTSWR